MNELRPKQINRLPPHDSMSEQAVLGAVLLDCNLCMPQCVEALKSGPEMFYDLRHAEIYRAMLELQETRKPIDLVTLHQRLSDKKLLEEVGGDNYLANLPNMIASSYALEAYLSTVRDKYLLRKTVQCCTEGVARVYEDESNADGLIDQLEKDILAIRASVSSGKCVSAKDAVQAAITDLERYMERQGVICGLATGFIEFDKLTGGLNPGDLMIIAGYPGSGKTSLAMNIVENVVLDQKLPAGVFSLEMTAKSLALRMLCSRARVNGRDARDGALCHRDFPKLTTAASKIANSSLWVEDASDLSVFQLRAKARRMAQQYGIKLVVIDYLQLLTAIGGPRKVESRQQEVADISRGIKGLAKEIGVPVIALSQLNDDGALRESRAIGQDADIVTVIDRKENSDDVFVADWKIKKSRNGPTGVVSLTFLREYTRFENAAKIQDDPKGYKD